MNNDLNQTDQIYQEALDRFGEIAIQEIRDIAIGFCLNTLDGFGKTQTDQSVYKKMASCSPEQLEIVRRLICKAVDETLYLLLDNVSRKNHVKIMVETSEGSWVDLRDAGNKVSFDLVLEPLSWASQHSEYGMKDINDLS